jgi:hypothetical protein
MSLTSEVPARAVPATDDGVRLVVRPAEEVLLPRGATLGTVRAGLADLLRRPELRHARLEADGVAVTDSDAVGVRPLLPGATLSVVADRPRLTDGDAVRAFMRMPDATDNTQVEAWSELGDGTRVAEGTVSMGAAPEPSALRQRLAPNGEALVGYVGRVAMEKRVHLLKHIADLPGIVRLARLYGDDAVDAAGPQQRAQVGDRGRQVPQPGLEPVRPVEQPRRVAKRPAFGHRGVH